MALKFRSQFWSQFWSRFYLKSDPKMAPKIVLKLIKKMIKKLARFLPILGQLLEQFWGSVWAQDRPKRRQDEPKRCTESLKVAKWRHAFCIVFYSILAPKPVPRWPWEAQDGVQEAPESLQDLSKKRSKNRPKKYHFFDQFWSHVRTQSSLKKLKKCSKNGPKNNMFFVVFWPTLGPKIAPRVMVLIRRRPPWVEPFLT